MNGTRPGGPYYDYRPLASLPVLKKYAPEYYDWPLSSRQVALVGFCDRAKTTSRR